MNVMKATEIENPKALRIIYGKPGMGKTSTIKYAPGKKLVIDIDGTSSVLQGAEDIDVVKVEDETNYRDSLPKLLKEIKEEHSNEYDVIMLDNISALETMMLTEYGKKGNNNGVPGIQNYQQLQFFELDLISYLKSMDKEVVISAWEQNDDFTTESGQIFSRSYPQIRKPILTNVMGLCLQVAHLRVSPKTGARFFELEPTDSLFAKNQLDNRPYCLQEDLFKTGDIELETDKTKK